jgi:hypothetical protein
MNSIYYILIVLTHLFASPTTTFLEHNFYNILPQLFDLIRNYL